MSTVTMMVSLLFACASGAAPTPQIKIVTVDIKEFAYAPARISAKAGETVQIEIKNSGSVLHDTQPNPILCMAIWRCATVRPIWMC